MNDIRGMLERDMGITRGDAVTDPPMFALGIGSGSTELSQTEFENLLKGQDAATAIKVDYTAGTTQTQAGATALTARFNVIATCANANDGVVLPLAVKGLVVIVVNKGAQIAKIYPNTSDTIDGGTADVAITIPVGGSYTFRADGAVNWFAEKTAVQIDFGIGTLDGSNPTPVTHRLNQIIGASVTQIGTAAPGLDPTYLTYALASNVFNVYAWKPTSSANPTLIASTNNTVTFFWVAFGY